MWWIFLLLSISSVLGQSCPPTVQNNIVHMMYINPSPTSPEIPTYANYTIVYNFWLTFGPSYEPVGVALAQLGFESYNDNLWCQKIITNIFGPLNETDLYFRTLTCLNQMASYPTTDVFQRRGFFINEVNSLLFMTTNQSQSINIICNVTLPGTPIPPVQSPVASPVQSPVEPPIESPVQSPVEAPIESPVEAPIDPPIESPVQSPVEPPIQSPVASPVQNPIAPAESPSSPAVIRSYKMVTCGNQLNRGCKPFVPIGTLTVTKKNTNLTLDVHIIPVRKIHKLSIYANSSIPVISNPDQFPIQRFVVPTNRYVESFTVTGDPIYVIVYGVQGGKHQITNKMWNLGDFKQGTFPLEVIVV